MVLGQPVRHRDAVGAGGPATRGMGYRLMREAEAEAGRRGCTDILVSSYSFQAPEFYKRLGYHETGRLDGVPGGHQDVYLQKSLGVDR